jgi:hypothetical protein
MFGRLLSKTIKLVTLPVDLAEATLDVATGGDGSRRSRRQLRHDIPLPSSLRDAVCNTIEDVLDD